MGCKIAIENDPFSSLIYRLKMVMLHSELFVYQRVGFLQQLSPTIERLSNSCQLLTENEKSQENESASSSFSKHGHKFLVFTSFSHIRISLHEVLVTFTISLQAFFPRRNRWLAVLRRCLLRFGEMGRGEGCRKNLRPSWRRSTWSASKKMWLSIEAFSFNQLLMIKYWL